MHGLGRLFFILYEIFSTVCRDSFFVVNVFFTSIKNQEEIRWETGIVYLLFFR